MKSHRPSLHQNVVYRPIALRSTLAPSLPAEPVAPRGPVGPAGPFAPRSPGKPLSPWGSARNQSSAVITSTRAQMLIPQCRTGHLHLSGRLKHTYSGSRWAGGTGLTSRALRKRERELGEALTGRLQVTESLTGRLQITESLMTGRLR